MYGPKQQAFHNFHADLSNADPLGRDDLKDVFFEHKVAEWIAYRSAKGKLMVEPAGKTGIHNCERAVKNGGKKIGQCINVSRKAALRAAAGQEANIVPKAT